MTTPTTGAPASPVSPNPDPLLAQALLNVAWVLANRGHEDIPVVMASAIRIARKAQDALVLTGDTNPARTQRTNQLWDAAWHLATAATGHPDQLAEAIRTLTEQHQGDGADDAQQ